MAVKLYNPSVDIAHHGERYRWTCPLCGGVATSKGFFDTLRIAKNHMGRLWCYLTLRWMIWT